MLPKTRLLLIPLALLVALGLVWLVVLTPGQPPARRPLPKPNGYDDFVQAGEAVTGNVSDYGLLSAEPLRAMVSTNAAALRLLRLGLTRQCLMPTDSLLTNIDAMPHEMASIKRLAYLMAAEGRLRELDNQPAQAAHCYCEDVRLGNEMSRGGFLINRLVGIACENIGCSGLARVAPNLSAAEARPVIAELEKIDAAHVTWAETVQNEHEFVRYNLRRYHNPLMWVVNWWSTRAVLKRAEAKHNQVVAQERLLTMELALRCCRDEGHPIPQSLDGLLTNYLTRVPVDPFTAKPLVYQASGTNWQVYSAGPEGRNGGGKSGSPGSSGKGDSRFDSR